MTETVIIAAEQNWFSFVYTYFRTLSECHKWFAAPISSCSRSGPRGCFRSECCTGGESIAAPRMNRFIAPIHQQAKINKSFSKEIPLNMLLSY